MKGSIWIFPKYLLGIIHEVDKLDPQLRGEIWNFSKCFSTRIQPGSRQVGSPRWVKMLTISLSYQISSWSCRVDKSDLELHPKKSRKCRITHSTVRLIDAADSMLRHPPYRFKPSYDQSTKNILSMEDVRMVDKSDSQVPPIIVQKF